MAVVVQMEAKGLTIQQYDQANEAFRVAVAQPGSKAIYRVRWGLLLHERFNNKEAVDLFNEALQQDPSNAQAYLGLAVVSADGFDSKAAEYAAKALTLDPDNWHFKDSRGLARALTGNIEGAIEDFQAYVERTDDAEFKSQREDWIAALRKGKKPFSAAVLKSLSSQ